MVDTIDTIDTKNHMERFTTSDNIELAIDGFGDGPCLLLVHGSFVDSAVWDGVVPLLAPQFSVYLLDRRGHGSSAFYTADHAFEREFDDLDEVIAALPSPVTILAHDTGVYLAIHAALRAPERIAQLILYEPLAPPRHLNHPLIEELQRRVQADDIEGLTAFALRELLMPMLGMGIQPDVLNRLMDSPLAHILARNTQAFPIELEAYSKYTFHKQRFTALTMPILFLGGGNSPLNYRSIADQLHSVTPANSQFLTLVGQDHTAMLNAPDLLVGAVITFMRDQLSL